MCKAQKIKSSQAQDYSGLPLAYQKMVQTVQIESLLCSILYTILMLLVNNHIIKLIKTYLFSTYPSMCLENRRNR